MEAVTGAQLLPGFASRQVIYDAGPLALAMHVAAISYLAEHPNDDFYLSPATIRRLLDADAPEEIADALVVAGVWACAAEGGYHVADPLVRIPTRSDRERRSAANANGGRARAERVASEAAASFEQSGSESLAIPQRIASDSLAPPLPLPLIPPPSPPLSPPAPPLVTPSPTPYNPPPSLALAARVDTAPARTNARRARAGPDDYTPEFEAWFAAYPRQEHKFEAFQAYRSRLAAGVSIDSLLTAAVNTAVYVARDSIETRFVPLPATFLNKRRDLEFANGLPTSRAPPQPKTVFQKNMEATAIALAQTYGVTVEEVP